MRNNNLLYQFKIISIVIVALIFLSLLYVLLNAEMTDYKNNIIENWTTWQSKTLESALSDVLTLNPEGFEAETVEKVIPDLQFNEASYVVFYKDKKVVFERNNEITNDKFGKNIRALYGEYSYNGGYHLAEVLEIMEKGQSGSDYFVKDHFKGNEYITWKAFKLGGSSYILGSVTAERYILSLYNYETTKNNFYGFAYVYTFLMILYATLLCFSVFRYNDRVGKLSYELDSAEKKIMNLKIQLNEVDKKFESLSVYDFLTGIYNRKFFDIFFPKVEAEIFIPVSVAILDINGLKLINSAFGYKMGDLVLVKVSEICKMHCDDNDVIARYGNDEFAIMMINTTYEDAVEKMIDISNAVTQEYSKGMDVDISFGVSTKNSEDENMHDVIATAEQNLETDKLTAINSTHSGAVKMLSRILHEKTSETEEHCERISYYAELLAKEVGMNDKKVRELKLLAYLHDVGKISMPDTILNKESSLTEEEYEIMKTHPEKGYNIAMASPDLKSIAKYIYQHHERWDGTGYPKGILGEKITIEARIISITDAFDAMVSRRIYKDKIDINDALDEIERCAGTQFDPDLALTFVEIVRRQIKEGSVLQL